MGEKVSEDIIRIRKSKGYSQDRACLEAGLARGTLSKIESGKVEPRVYTFAMIAITLDAPLRKLTDVAVED